jgi:uncharacterized membrane protein
VAEEDEPNRQADTAATSPRTEDNSLGRLLTLSDGVFAIAMTLLALDLKPPNLSGHVTNQHLIHALAQHTDSYWSFILSFYIIAIFWGGHRRLLRSVTVFTPNLVRDTVFLLLLMAAMPFPASLLGMYGSTPFALAVYGAVSALATLALIVLAYDVRRSDPGSRKAATPADELAWWTSWANLGVFLLCIPAGYVLGGNGPFVLLLLVLTNRLPLLKSLAHRYRTGPPRFRIGRR